MKNLAAQKCFWWFWFATRHFHIVINLHHPIFWAYAQIRGYKSHLDKVWNHLSPWLAIIKAVIVPHEHRVIWRNTCAGCLLLARGVGWLGPEAVTTYQELSPNPTWCRYGHLVQTSACHKYQITHNCRSARSPFTKSTCCLIVTSRASSSPIFTLCLSYFSQSDEFLSQMKIKSNLSIV